MKVVIIGAGSAFGSRLSIDILSREPLNHATIGLCDINTDRLETVRAYVQAAISHHNLPAKVVASADRRQVLPGADFVIISVAVGGPAYYGRPYELEMDIPRKYGIRQTVGDTIGPGGIFRGLRSAPTLMEFCRDINALAPNAAIINYTNPMAMMTWVLNRAADVPVVGLCHGVQGTARLLAKAIGVPHDEIAYWVAGINHMAWFLEFTHNGADAYPLLKSDRVAPEILEQQAVRFDIMRHFGFFCTESPRHCAEYMPYFRAQTDMLERFRDQIRGVKGRRASWFEDMGVKAADADSIELVRSHEYASAIIEAMTTGAPFRFNGNVINNGLITNLPQGCCVEVPCLVDACGIHPCHVGDLPDQCAALCRTNVNVQQLAVRAALNRDREAAYHALLLDPITAAALSMDKARDMFEELWQAEGDLLAYYD